ncbi:MAG: DUF3617 domain-containing protein [Nitrospiraceae bacterium]|nr:DUF3617 domain-containing protein [Nitrospiraceae bacterium]
MMNRGRMLAAAVVVTVVGTLPVAMAPWAPDSAMADSFNLKPGAWEITTLVERSGPPVAPDILSKLPPEQRARMEQAAKARAGNSKTLVSKECITKEELDQDRLFAGADDGDGAPCPTKVITRSSNKLEIERSCPAPAESVSHLLLQAPSPDSLIGRFDTTRRGQKVHSEMKGRWLGASCAGIE